MTFPLQLPGVESVDDSAPLYLLAGRQMHPEPTVVEVRGVRVGDGTFTVIAGPCAVESREQLMETAIAAKAAGADMLRGGAFKPRTSPYDFQGLGAEGLRLLAEARRVTGLPVVTEVLDTADVELVAEYADVQVRVRHKDGEWRWLEGAFTNMIDEPHVGAIVNNFRDITERKRAEDENRRLVSVLGERVKELTALHNATRVLQQQQVDTASVLRELAELLPPAFQYPEITAARVRLGPVGATTAGFASSPPALRADCMTANGQPCSIEVVYTAERPPTAEGPFLAEERRLINTLADMLRAAYDRRQAEEQLRQTTEQLRSLSASLRSAREEEAARIAREIHDELGAALSSLRWDLEEVGEVVSEAADAPRLAALRRKIADMMGLTDAAVNTVRRIASELRPVALDDLGLADAIEWQAGQFQARTGIVVLCDCRLESVELSREQSTAVFRIFQEALTNVLRHARATRVDVALKREFGRLTLTVSDNGRGITEEERTGAQTLGLLGMRERANLAGGELVITGDEGKGTTITVRVPING